MKWFLKHESVGRSFLNFGSDERKELIHVEISLRGAYCMDAKIMLKA